MAGLSAPNNPRQVTSGYVKLKYLWQESTCQFNIDKKLRLFIIKILIYLFQYLTPTLRVISIKTVGHLTSLDISDVDTVWTWGKTMSYPASVGIKQKIIQVIL